MPIAPNKVRAVLSRMERRGELKRVERGLYIFLEQKATPVPRKQQKATVSRGDVPSGFSGVSDTSNSKATLSAGTYGGVPASRRVLVILYNMSPKTFTPKSLTSWIFSRLREDSSNLKYKKIHGAVKKALQRHYKRGLLRKTRGNRYYVPEKEREKVQEWLQGKEGVPPRGGGALFDNPTYLTVIENRKRILKPVTLTFEEYLEVFASASEIPNIIIRKTKKEDRAHQTILENDVVRFVFSWNSKKAHWKLMIYFPGNPRDPLKYLETVGIPFYVTERIEAMGIKQDTVLNLDEVMGALIKKHGHDLDVNFSDFGGDLEHTGEAKAGRIFARIIQDAELAEELAGYQTQIPRLEREMQKLNENVSKLVETLSTALLNNENQRDISQSMQPPGGMYR